MSIIYCEKHDRLWDSDRLEECPLCNNEPKVYATDDPEGHREAESSGEHAMTPEAQFENICDELKVQMAPHLYEAVRIFSDRLTLSRPVPADSSTWISVAERLPEPNELVCVWVDSYYQGKGGPDQAMMQNNSWTNMRYRQSLSVTHWMPLPAAPAQTKEEK